MPRLAFKKVAVLMGGLSAERDVSLKTGDACANALRGLGYTVAGIDMGLDVVQAIDKKKPDAVLIALHGRYGEDGTIQGVLEILGIPYAGSGVLASALAMDKIVSKKIFRHEGIPVAPDVPCYLGEYKASPEDSLKRVETEVGLPVIIKPNREGSTIGCTIVTDRSELKTALETAFECDDQVLAEKFVEGRLLTVGLVGKEPTPLPIVEVIAKKGFYDYESKYTTGMTEYVCPAVIDPDETKRLQEIAVRVHKALGCEDISRVDIILGQDGRDYVLELNTLPGMTETSLVPKAAKAAGIGFPELVEMILSGASLKLGCAR